MRTLTRKRQLDVVYVLPSRYDDEGYVHRYWRGVLPSNTLACLKSLTQALADSGALGPDVHLTIAIYDDSVQKVPIDRIIRRSKAADAKLVVGLVGVQSNQFARAADLATQFRAAGAQVMVGGFHVSGILAMFPGPTPELRRLLDLGVTLVRGEAEAPGVLAEILTDALHERLKPIYHIIDPPDLTNAEVPVADPEYLRHFVWRSMGTIDTSRGCPFNCSFCTIINVQGRKMRHRSAEKILQSIRSNYARGVKTYFFTDDNLSRCPVWESLFDGLAQMRDEGMPVRFMMQVDTQAWKIPRFVEKANAAGCYLVFVGMETLNPENLADSGKRQNKVGEYAGMVDAWHDAGILVEVGYIIGFPHDTVDSVRRDLEALKNEVRVDEAAFFMLTPLPGSQDHKRMVERRVPMDADLNRFDSFHETYRHERLRPGEWRALYEEAWDTFYSKEHLLNLLLRAPRGAYWRLFWLAIWNRYSILLKSHPMVTGLIRLKGRTERRADFPRESRLTYTVRRAKETLELAGILAHILFEFEELWMLSRRRDDPRWAALAEIHTKWAAAQRAISECELAGRCDEAVGALGDVLKSSAAKLREMCAEGAAISGRLRRRLRRKADDIDAYLRALDAQPPSWRRVFETQQFVRDGLLAGYEELAIRYVARRRQFNAYRAEVINRLASWRILTLDVSPIPRMLLFEVTMALRLTLAFSAGKSSHG
jgi:radical SAM superfamily enzyme YgiQ (UPF0313 family)